jgi:tRNA uridine 5-carboxymethylaminomethyl modification enzyme
VIGVKTGMSLEIRSKAVILTNGTFLNGRIYIGEKQFRGGRTGEKSATGLTEQLVALGFEAGRMKTGTPPRVDGRTLNYRKMEEQSGDEQPGKFSFLDSTQPLQQQKSCYLTYTNEKVHQILASGFGQSPMLNGHIQGQGPRYCPSIEDKITRFADRERHQRFMSMDFLRLCPKLCSTRHYKPFQALNVQKCFAQAMPLNTTTCQPHSSRLL